MGSKSKVKGFDLFADMRKGNQTFSDRSDALNSAVGSDTTVTFEDKPIIIADTLTVEEKAVIALTNAVKDYLSTIKGNGLGKKTIDGFKEVTRNALGVKRMGAKRYHQIIDLCPQLEVITKESGRSYFNVIDVPTIVEDQNEQEETPVIEKPRNKIDKKVNALFEQYLADKDEHCDEDGWFVSVCTCCGSVEMPLYLNSKKKLRCGACNDLHYEESYNLYPYQVSSSDRDMIGAVRFKGKKTKKGVKYNGWIVTNDDKLVRVGK